MFTRGLGGPVYPDTVSQLIPRLVEAHNRKAKRPDKLPRARLHDLRHVHATTLLLAGAPVRRCTWSRNGSDTPIPRSRCACMHT